MRVTEESPEGCANTTENYNVLIDECTGLSENISQEIRIYPNPARDIVNIQLAGKIKELHVFNYTGAKVREVQVNESMCSVSCTGLKKGIYTFRIITDHAIITRQEIIN